MAHWLPLGFLMETKSTSDHAFSPTANAGVYGEFRTNDPGNTHLWRDRIAIRNSHDLIAGEHVQVECIDENEP